MISSLPKQRRERIDLGYREINGEIEMLKDLRKAAGKAQADIAAALRVKQPTVSKMERQADMYLSTLRSYVEAMGGELDLIVRLPSRRPMHLKWLGRTPGTSGQRTTRRVAAPRPTKPRRSGA
jgi:DNA-binding XRE family transcriptional regulator